MSGLSETTERGRPTRRGVNAQRHAGSPALLLIDGSYPACQIINSPSIKLALGETAPETLRPLTGGGTRGARPESNRFAHSPTPRSEAASYPCALPGTRTHPHADRTHQCTSLIHLTLPSAPSLRAQKGAPERHVPPRSAAYVLLGLPTGGGRTPARRRWRRGSPCRARRARTSQRARGPSRRHRRPPRGRAAAAPGSATPGCR